MKNENKNIYSYRLSRILKIILEFFYILIELCTYFPLKKVFLKNQTDIAFPTTPMVCLNSAA